MCQCVMCGGRYRVVRWILGLVVILGAFWVGVKVGELKALRRSGYYGFRGGMGPGMMYGWNGSAGPWMMYGAPQGGTYAPQGMMYGFSADGSADGSLPQGGMGTWKAVPAQGATGTAGYAPGMRWNGQQWVTAQ